MSISFIIDMIDEPQKRETRIGVLVKNPASITGI